MNAIEILQSLCEEKFDLTTCNIISGAAILELGVQSYFGLPVYDGVIVSEKLYFHICCPFYWLPKKMSAPSVIVGTDDEHPFYFLFEIED